MTLDETKHMGKKHKDSKGLLSREEAKAEIIRRGLTVRQWSQDRGLSEKTVFQVLGGRNKGNFGEAHKAAVLLGIKDGVVE